MDAGVLDAWKRSSRRENRRMVMVSPRISSCEKVVDKTHTEGYLLW
jgi:hypothetical protein